MHACIENQHLTDGRKIIVLKKNDKLSQRRQYDVKLMAFISEK